MKDTFKVISIWIVLWVVLEWIIPGNVNPMSLGIYFGSIFGYLVYGYSHYLEKKEKIKDKI